MPTSPLLKINRIALVNFYDTIPKDSIGHASAINAIAGEDLGAGLLMHYLRNVTGAKVTILDEKCNLGTLRGNRLDRWMLVEQAISETLYQVEIKNWSAHAKGGRRLALNASPEQVAAYKIKEWAKEWNEELKELRGETTRKVLLPMKVSRLQTVEPLLCMWSAMHPTGALEPFFEVQLPDGSHFSRLQVFSMSAYLRSINDDHLEIEMPQTIDRLNWLKRLFDADA